jgi:hypothetical protein
VEGIRLESFQRQKNNIFKEYDMIHIRSGIKYVCRSSSECGQNLNVPSQANSLLAKQHIQVAIPHSLQMPTENLVLNVLGMMSIVGAL